MINFYIKLDNTILEGTPLWATTTGIINELRNLNVLNTVKHKHTAHNVQM